MKQQKVTFIHYIYISGKLSLNDFFGSNGRMAHSGANVQNIIHNDRLCIHLHLVSLSIAFVPRNVCNIVKICINAVGTD